MSKRRKKMSCSGKRFARLPLWVMQTEALTTLSHAQFRVLVLLASQYTGYNNGAVGITRTQAASQGVPAKTLYRCLRELEKRGLIETTRLASRVPPRPTMYALAWEPKHDTDYSNATRKASYAFRDWQRKPRLTVVGGKRATG